MDSIDAAADDDDADADGNRWVGGIIAHNNPMGKKQRQPQIQNQLLIRSYQTASRNLNQPRKPSNRQTRMEWGRGPVKLDQLSLDSFPLTYIHAIDTSLTCKNCIQAEGRKIDDNAVKLRGVSRRAFVLVACLSLSLALGYSNV